MDEQAPADEETGTAVPPAQQPPAQAARPERQRSSIPSFLFISFLLFMLTSHNGDEFLARHQYQDDIQSLSVQLGNYTAWLNGTLSNFTLPERDPFVDPLLSSFSVYSPPLDPLLASYYPNITGFIHGDATFYNITPSHISLNDSKEAWRTPAENFMAGVNMTQLVGNVRSWNWAASNRITLSVVEKKPQQATGNRPVPEDIALIHGRIELTDAKTAEDLRLEFEGVHFVGNGSIYGFAGPGGKHIDIRLLPSIVPDERRNETASIIAPEISARIEKLRTLIDAGVIDQDLPSSSDENPRSACQFSVYAQIESAPVPEFLMQELEDEIQKPTGVWTVKPPKLAVGGLMISKECGIMYKVTNTEGLRSRMFFRKVSTYASTAAVTYLALIILLSRQMEQSRTPAGISRLSRWTFLTQAIVDSVSFAGHVTFAVLAEGRPSLSLIAPAFLACLLFIYEAQVSLLIHEVQLPESVILSPPPPPASSPTPPHTNSTLAQPAALPAPAAQPTATATTPALRSTIWRSIVQHLRSNAQARLWFTLFILLTIIVRVVLSPSLALAFVAIMYSCFWLPQIVRSVRRGRSSALSKEYLFGTTICRLFFAVYFLACPKNVLDVEPRPWVYLLAFFMFVQVFVIILQECFGPAFFLPKRYAAVQTYDYHPPMPVPDSESPEQSLGDCAICMDAIRLDRTRRRSQSTDRKDLSERSEKGVSMSVGLLDAVQKGVGVTARKNYSLAPCHHLFHTECLETWLAIKNICPQCRRPLPPL